MSKKIILHLKRSDYIWQYLLSGNWYSIYNKNVKENRRNRGT